jgi:hypothetical protein
MQASWALWLKSEGGLAGTETLAAGDTDPGKYQIKDVSDLYLQLPP